MLHCARLIGDAALCKIDWG